MNKINCLDKFENQYFTIEAHPKKKGKKIIQHTPSQETFGFEESSITRLKFGISIPLFALPILLFQIAYRVYDLITLGFFHRGRVSAIKKSTNKPLLTRTVIFESLKDLTIHVAKIPLLVLALIPKLSICIVGIFLPKICRRIFTKLDTFFYVNPRDLYKKQNHIMLFANLNAHCMTTRQFFKEKNLARYLDNYDISRAKKVHLASKVPTTAQLPHESGSNRISGGAGFSDGAEEL